MKRTPLRRRTPLRAAGRPKPKLKRFTLKSTKSAMQRKKRKPSEFSRIYGSKERAAWVKSQPCAWASGACCGEIQNAHTGTGGMGRKSDACTIVPLCAYHHRRFDQHRFPFDVDLRRDVLKTFAQTVNAAWHSHCAALAAGDETR